MPQTQGSSSVDTPRAVAEVCISCRFGTGTDRACSLLKRGDQQTLFEQGPCNVSDRIHKSVRRAIHRRYPFAQAQADDYASEVLLKILEGERLLVPETIHHLPDLERRLGEVVRNGLIDVLRHHRVITRLRCGACAHFGELPSGQSGCTHAPSIDGSDDPHPWAGRPLSAEADPRRQDPPCPTFTWHRKESEDLISEAFEGHSGELTARQKALQILLKGIDVMAREGPIGMKAASTLFWHHFGGRSVGRLAEDHDVSEKTIKRQLAEGRTRLERILKRDFGVDDLTDLE